MHTESPAVTVYTKQVATTMSEDRRWQLAAWAGSN